MYLTEHFVKKVAALHTVNPLTVNFHHWYVSKHFTKFYKTVFKTIFKNAFCQWVNSSEHMLNQQTSFFENCFFSLSQFRKELWKASTLGLKNLGLLCRPRIKFMIYWTWTRKILELPYWNRIDLMISWS